MFANQKFTLPEVAPVLWHCEDFEPLESLTFLTMITVPKERPVTVLMPAV